MKNSKKNNKNTHKNKFKKRGSLFIATGVIVLIIILASVFLVYYQLNVILETVRQDLFYAAKNAIHSFDLQDLAYKKYTVDENQTKEIIEYLLNKNYTENNGAITKIEVKKIDIQMVGNKVNLKIQIEVNFNSVIAVLGNKEHSFRMNETVKIALMDYVGE